MTYIVLEKTNVKCSEMLLYLIRKINEIKGSQRKKKEIVKMIDLLLNIEVVENLWSLYA